MPSATELTRDPAFARRVARLAVVSALALALIWRLARTTLHPDPLISRALGAGWLLMPSVLALSLRWPRLRYALVVPAAAVSLGLVAICFAHAPAHPAARVGWWLTTTGVLLGGVMGMWFWFRWLPVPSRLADPFSPGRWAFIALHVCLVVTGLALVTLGSVL